MKAAGSKPLTSPANLVAKSLASNSVIGAIPLLPATSAPQVSSRPMPSGVTRPMPVTTTLRALMISPPRLRGRVRLDVLDGVLDRADLLGVLVGDLDREGLLEGEHELDHRERVGLEIVRERRLGTD